MPDISIGDTAVTVSSDAAVNPILLGATAVPGDVLYYDTVSSSWKLADADASASAGSGTDAYLMMALSGGASGQRIVAAAAGVTVTMDAVLTKGTVYYLSTTAGGMTNTAPSTGDFLAIVGYATSTTTLVLMLKSTGVEI